MRIVIVTGMSGAGKTTALKIFEDAGYYCVDNLPPSFMGQFAQFLIERDTGINKVALGIDIRGGEMFSDFSNGLNNLKHIGVEHQILFLEASNEVLLNRYKETRHLHPLAKNDLVSVGITKERVLLESAKRTATYIMDTSHLLPRQLKEKILHVFSDETLIKRLMINITSFGFKYGIPDDSDLVFDVRFLPNPFYIPDLKPFSGMDTPVRDFVMNHDVTIRFTESLLSMLEFLIPHYISEGKNQLIVSIGCTGGRHRSVAISEEIFKALTKRDNSVMVFHRDIVNDPQKSRT